MTKEIKRRSRGASPRGEFEQSKNVANAIIDERRDAERCKTERLKTARLEKMNSESSQTRERFAGLHVQREPTDRLVSKT